LKGFLLLWLRTWHFFVLLLVQPIKLVSLKDNAFVLFDVEDEGQHQKAIEDNQDRTST
jgi:hypothetical protein